MAISITHNKVTAKSNDPAYDVSADAWNEAHVVTGAVEGSGTTNTVPKFTGTNAIGNSNITDDGTTVTIGNGSAVNYSIKYNGSNIGAITWQNTNQSFNVLTAGAAYWDYPSYPSSLVVNTTTTKNNDTRQAFASWITSTGTQTSCELAGFFGGFRDEGTSGVNSGLVIGSEGYNYLGATNARTITNVQGGLFNNEFASGSNVTATNVTGCWASANKYGTFTTTNMYALYVACGGSSGTVTNNYGLYLENITTGTNKWSIYSAGGDNYLAGTVQAGGYKSSDGSAGATGSFTTADLKTVTVKDGIITSIV